MQRFIFRFRIHKSILLILLCSFCVTGSSLFAQCPVSVSVSYQAFGQGEIQCTPSVNAVSYQWQHNGFDIPGGITRIYPVSMSGNYSVRITTSTGCTSVSPEVAVTLTNNKNYVITNEIRKPGVTSNEQVNTLGADDISQNVSYLDALGRSKQEVTTKSSTNGNDMVAFTNYDEVNRVPLTYLPVPYGSGGEFKTDIINAQSNYYQTVKGDQWTYAEKRFDNSPLNRVVEQNAPGESWSMHTGTNRTLKTFYGKNGSGEIRLWNYNPANGSVSGASFYNANELLVTQQINEQGQKIVVYKDKSGLLICKRVQRIKDYVGDYLYTYYVYDDLGNLRYTITPEGLKDLAAGNYTFGYNDVITKKWFYAYNYDARNRLTVKRTPGAGEEYIVYDSRDRMVFAQHANQRNNNNQWLATLYDVLDRPVITGLVNISASLSQMQDAVNSQTADVGNDPQITMIDGQPIYKNPLPAGTAFELLSATYYDDYSWVAGTGTTLTSKMDETYARVSLYFILASSAPVYAQPVKANHHVKGKATGNKIKILGTNQFLYTVTFYDAEGRTIQIQTINQTGGRDVITSQYDFSGKLLRKLHQFRTLGANARNVLVCTKNEYNRSGLLTKVWKKINGETDRLIATNVYNEIGELETKTLGNSIEKLNYEYNIRGWLTSVNKDFLRAPEYTNFDHWFGMELAYDKTTSVIINNSYSNPQYAGNVSGVLWRTRGTGVKRKFEYTYDNMDRLIAAGFKQQFGTAWGNSDPNTPNFNIDFSVGGKGNGNQYIEYDDNGNIKNCWRKGLKINASPLIDDLTYSYSSGNQLGSVTDGQTAPNPGLGDFQDGANSGIDYIYDDNGNLTKDENKKITGIVYNHQNLPQIITFSNNNGSTNTITYTYDAGGGKLQKAVVDNNTPGKTITITNKYINGCVYESRITTNRSAVDPPDYADKLLYLPHEEGRLRWVDVAAGSSFVTDFFITDNLGNVRMILSAFGSNNVYPLASMENVQNKDDLTDVNNYIPYYGNVDYTTNAGVRTAISSIPGYPTTGDVNATTPNDYVARLNGNGNKIGPSMILKVMAGDQINIRVSSWYKTNGATPGSPVDPLSDLVAGLANGVGGMAGSKLSAADLQSSGFLGPNIFEFLNGKTVDPNRPKAYLNWIFFDEQFKYEQSGSSFAQVPLESEYLNNTSAPIVKWLTSNWYPAEKNGYLYVYVSNETPNIDVYFDNLQVTHSRGPLLEENHYYPMGMAMAGICSRALNGLSVNKIKFQGQEYEDALNLNMSEFELRQYDPQLGRWVVRDPANQFPSPYQAMANNWPNGTDPDGAYFGVDDIIVTAAGFAFGYLISGLETDDWGWRSVRSGLITAAMFEVGYLTGGSAALAESQAVLSASTTASYATMGTYIATTVATSAVAQFMPSIPIGDNFSISPAIVFGSQGISAGATVNYHSGNFSAGIGIGNGADGPKFSYGGGWDDGKTGFSYYRTNYSRSYKQASAQLGLRFGSVSIRFDDDLFGDGKDRYRTGALRVGYSLSNGDEIAAGFRIRTGEVIGDDTETDPRSKKGKVQYSNEFNIQREGLLYGGYTRRGFGINAGVNSEKVRYGIQNKIHDWLNAVGGHDRHFKYIPDAPSGLYGEMGRFYPFALY